MSRKGSKMVWNLLLSRLHELFKVLRNYVTSQSHLSPCHIVVVAPQHLITGDLRDLSPVRVMWRGHLHLFPSSGQIFPIRRAVPTPAIPLRCQTLPVPSVWEEICPQWPPVKTCQSPPFSTHQPHSSLPKLTDIWEHRADWHHHWATWTALQGWIYLVSMEETAPSDLYHKRD